MCIKNTHFKCLKSYYRDSRVEVTHLFLECRKGQTYALYTEQLNKRKLVH